MVLVDTSVWVAHLRSGDARLGRLLERGVVACHPFVVGEIACGNIQNRKEVLARLRKLPSVPVISPEEFLAFIERNGLAGAGVGFVDAHLLASARLAGISLLSADRALSAAAQRLGLSYPQAGL